LLAVALEDPGRAGHRIAQGLRRDRRLGSKDRPWVADALYGIVRRRRLLELLLRAGGWRGEDPAAAFWWGWLVLTRGLAPLLAPVETAWLGHLHQPRPALAAWGEGRSEAEWLAHVGSVPDWLAEALLEGRTVGSAFAELAALDGRAPVVLRVVRTRAHREEVIAELSAAGLSARPGRWCDGAVVVEGRVQLEGLRCWREGRVALQDEASQLVAELVAPPPGGLVVDACAGAGGKSLAIAGRAAGDVRILSLDVRKGALAEARRRADREGVRLETRALRVEGPVPVAAGSAERVLVDAPCTGTGTLRRSPGLRWRWDAERASAFPVQQDVLLRRHAPLVSPGGRLIYATCSLWHQENLRRVQAFLDAHPGWRLLPIDVVLGSARAEPLSEGGMLVMTPAKHGTDGFFAAVLERPPAL